VPCCHGGSPVTIHGDFPFCPEVPYDFCRSFDRVWFRVGQTWLRDGTQETAVVSSVEGRTVCLRLSNGRIVRGTDEEMQRELSNGWFPTAPQAPADDRVHQPDYPEVEGLVTPIYGCPMPPESVSPELRKALGLRSLLDGAIPLPGAPDGVERPR
jgi:hypothetical protein